MSLFLRKDQIKIKQDGTYYEVGVISETSQTEKIRLIEEKGNEYEDYMRGVGTRISSAYNQIFTTEIELEGSKNHLASRVREAITDPISEVADARIGYNEQQYTVLSSRLDTERRQNHIVNESQEKQIEDSKVTLDDHKVRIGNLENLFYGLFTTESINDDVSLTKAIPDKSLPYADIAYIGGYTCEEEEDGERYIYPISINSIVSKSSSGEIIDTINLLNIAYDNFGNDIYNGGGMKSVGNVYDEINFDAGVSIHRVGSVMLENLNWSYQSVISCWVADKPSGDNACATLSNGILNNIVSSNYNNAIYNNANIGVGNISGTNTQKIVVNTGSSTISPSGLCYYELETPKTNSIGEFDNEIKVVSGGTLTFRSIYDESFDRAIPSEIIYRVSIL